MIVAVEVGDAVGETTAAPPQAATSVAATTRVSAAQGPLRRSVRGSTIAMCGQLQPLVVPQVMHL